MNQFLTKHIIRFIISLALILSVACERDATKSVFVDDPQVKPDPVVTSIEPANGSLSGIGQITINGSNFSPTAEKNVIFFGSEKATVLSASASQLIIKTPRLLGDSIEVKVSVIGALGYSDPIFYKLQEATEEMGGYGNVSEDLFAITVDANENVYVYRSIRFIDLISPDSIGKVQSYATAPIVTRGMKMGPGGYLYLTKNNTTLYRISPGGGNQVPWSPLPQKVFDLDFDQAGNIYIAGEGDSLIIIYPDASSEGVAEYAGTFIKAVRVYNGYVYVAGFRASDSLGAVWRNQINAPNNLGPNELVFDVTAEMGKDIRVQSLTFAADGDMYIGTTALDPILVVHPDGSTEPLYPGVLDPEMFDMEWGNDVYLYVSRRPSVIAETESRILKINMQKMGAPYYGRQ